MLFNRRYFQLISFFGKLALQIIFWEIILRNLGFKQYARQTARKRYAKVAQHFRSLAVRMGGVLIKVGQFLSARVDVLPVYVTEELSGLQDEVKAEEYNVIKREIENEYGTEIDKKFTSFEIEPLAAASLGQVHRAVLFNDEKVVIKILRPKIDEIVKIDLAALGTAVGWLKHWRFVSKRADVVALLNEFSKTLYEELDYVAEAANAKVFAEMFKDDPGVRIPKVYSEFSTKRILVLEDVLFIKITDYDQITKAGIDRAEVAKRLLNTYLFQIFSHQFFHADPHPGNLFIEPLAREPHTNGESGSIDPQEKNRTPWRLVFVDFGMVGKVSPETILAGREMIISLATRDPKRMVQSYITLGALLPGTDLTELIEAETFIFDSFWGKSMDELRQIDMREYHQMMHQFGDLIYEMPFQIPSNVIYLARCIAILSGMCTGLDPDFNLFVELLPFAQQLLVEDKNGEGLEYWLNQIKEIGKKVLFIPGRLDNLVNRLERGELKTIIRVDRQQMARIDQINVSLTRLYGGVLFFGFLASGTALYLCRFQLLGYIGWGLAFIAFLWSITRR